MYRESRCYYDHCILSSSFTLWYIHEHWKNPGLVSILQEMIKFVLDQWFTPLLSCLAVPELSPWAFPGGPCQMPSFYCMQGGISPPLCSYAASRVTASWGSRTWIQHMQVGLGPARSLGQGLGKVAFESSKIYSFLRGAKCLPHGARHTKRLPCQYSCLGLQTSQLHCLPAFLACWAEPPFSRMGVPSTSALLSTFLLGRARGEATPCDLNFFEAKYHLLSLCCFLSLLFGALTAPSLCPLTHGDAFRQAQTAHGGMTWALQVFSHVITSLFRAIIPYY